MSEPTFLKGLFVKRKEKSPDFVIGQISIKREELIKTLQEMNGEWINLDILKEKDGDGIYSKINDWKPEQKVDTITPEDDSAIPF